MDRWWREGGERGLVLGCNKINRGVARKRSWGVRRGWSCQGGVETWFSRSRKNTITIIANQPPGGLVRRRTAMESTLKLLSPLPSPPPPLSLSLSRSILSLWAFYCIQSLDVLLYLYNPSNVEDFYEYFEDGKTRDGFLGRGIEEGILELMVLIFGVWGEAWWGMAMCLVLPWQRWKLDDVLRFEDRMEIGVWKVNFLFWIGNFEFWIFNLTFGFDDSKNLLLLIFMKKIWSFFYKFEFFLLILSAILDLD